MLRYALIFKKRFIWIVLFICVLNLSCRKEEKNKLIFAGASSVWWTAPTIVAVDHDLFSKYGLEVRTFDVLTGLASKNAVISGAADIGLVAATPLAMGAYSEEPVEILCRYAQSKSLIAILTRKEGDGAVTDKSKVVQEKVAIVPGTISEWYLYNFLKRYDPNNLAKKKEGKLDEVHLRPPDIPSVLRKENANTGVIWEPFVTAVLSDSSNKFNVVREEDIYTVSLYLITRPDVRKKKREEVKAFVKAVDKACSMINDPNEKIQYEIEKKYGYEAGSLDELWKKVDFSINQDAKIIKQEILDDIKIAIELGRTPEKHEPKLDHLFEYISSLKED